MRDMRFIQIMGIALIFMFSFLADSLFAHCQVPCGIYTDDLRIKMMEEDFVTIEKAMNQIMELSAANPVNYNQMVRWITTKDDHAGKIQETVNAYFLTQRIKPVESKEDKAYTDYANKLSLLHQILFYAMKTKQTTDLSHVAKLRTLLREFADVYFSPQDRQHLKDPH